MGFDLPKSESLYEFPIINFFIANSLKKKNVLNLTQ